MDEIIDFACAYDPSPVISGNAVRIAGISFPEVYREWRPMASAAKAMAEEQGGFCLLPFCHTVEAEAFGGHVNLGNERFGPRAGEFLCEKIEGFLKLPDIDFTSGRIAEVLKACRYLRRQEYEVVLQMSGPVTILNGLMDARHIFRGMRKDPGCMRQVFEKLERNLLSYYTEASSCGVSLFSYADAAGGVNILGPQMAGQYAEEFTYPFLKKLETACEGNAVTALCPKTVYALTGTGHAELTAIQMERSMTYGQACLHLIGREVFAGQMCMKNIGTGLKDNLVRAVRLL